MQLRSILFIGRLFTFVVLILFSCHPSSTKTVSTADTLVVEPVIVKEDSITALIRPVLVINKTNEIQAGGFFINRLDIDSIQYEKISRHVYYLTMANELTSEMHLSVDKEKTRKAIDFLKHNAESSSTSPEIYKVHYHLNAQAGKVLYNMSEVKYLDKNYIEIKRNFPNL